MAKAPQLPQPERIERAVATRSQTDLIQHAVSNPTSRRLLILALALGLAGSLAIVALGISLMAGAPDAAQVAQGTLPAGTRVLSDAEAATPVTSGAQDNSLAAHSELETAPGTLEQPALFAAGPLTDALRGQPAPYFGPNYARGDGRPVYICSVDAFASYLLLAQIQMTGLDVKHGFHLGVVPYEIDTADYVISQEQIGAHMDDGSWDCDLNTIDNVARTGYGVVTAVIDESAGGDGIYARGLANIYELKGKRIAVPADSSGEFFARYALRSAGLSESAATLVQFASIDDALAAFANGSADAVSGWNPNLTQAASAGGSPLVLSNELRVIVDVIVTSRRAMLSRPRVVQAFHDAWFEALGNQIANPDAGAAAIAAWGHADYTGISHENAGPDLRAQLATIAQATLAANQRLMAEPAPLLNLIDTAQLVWRVPEIERANASTLIDPRFVLTSAHIAEYFNSGAPVNPGFSLGRAGPPPGNGQAPAAAVANPLTQPPSSASAANSALTLGTLPCSSFSFLPNSFELTDESKSVLDICVLPVMTQRTASILRVEGSAAWPGPPGTYNEAQIREFARQRALSIVNYLIGRGITAKRFIVSGVAPPPGHRETQDLLQQAADRYVRMTLASGGP